MVTIARREIGIIKSQRRLKRDSRESAMMSPGGLSEAKQASWIKVVEGERGDGSWLRERLQNANSRTRRSKISLQHPQKKYCVVHLGKIEAVASTRATAGPCTLQAPGLFSYSALLSPLLPQPSFFSVLFWFQCDHEMALFSKRLTCHYCGRRSPRTGPVRKFHCDHCESDNYFDEVRSLCSEVMK